MATIQSRDLSSIQDEDLLRKMWQETEDFGRKKEIRAHMYKLREARLREFYTVDMDNTTTKYGLSKTPNRPSHGDSLVDQSFESFKTKEIRDSESPTRDTKFGIMSPNAGGWNIVTSKETSGDGKTHTVQSLATTEGKRNIPGGQTAFTGKNEQISSDRYDGDSKNYTHSTGDTSNTVLSESSVTGDANSKRIETKSTSVTSSSHFVTTKKSSGDDVCNYSDGAIRNSENSSNISSRNTEQQQRNNNTSSTTHQQNNTENIYENVNTNQSARNVTQQNTTTTEKTSSKLSSDPKRVEEAFRLAQLPGRVISVDVVLVNPTTKMITETKQLDDGTTVTTRQYEKFSESDVITTSGPNIDVNRITRNNARDVSSNSRTTTTTTTTREDRVNRNRVDQQHNDNRRQSSKKDEILETIILKQNQTNRNDYDQVDRRNSTDYVTNKEFYIDDYNTNRTVKKDLSQQYRTEKVHNIDNRRPNENDDRRSSNTTTTTTTTTIRTDDRKNRDEQLRNKQQQDSVNKRITVEVNAAHKAFANSLRCVSPDRESKKSNRSSSSPDKSFRSSRRSLSRETINSEVSKFSSATVTRSRTDLSKNLDYMRPTITSELKTTTYTDDYRKPARRDSSDIREDVKTSRNTSTIVLSEDTVDKVNIRDASPTKFERSVSPKKVPQNTPNLTPRGPSPSKTVRETSPVKKSPNDDVTPKSTPSNIERDASPSYPKKSSMSDIRGTSPQKPSNLRDVSPEKSFLSRSTEDNITTKTTIRSSPSPVKHLRDVSPNKTVSLEDIIDTPSYKSRSPSPNKTPRESTPVRSTVTIDNRENVNITSSINTKSVINQDITRNEDVIKRNKGPIVTDLDSEEVILVDSDDSNTDDVALRTTKVTTIKTTVNDNKNASDNFILNEKNASNTLKRKDTSEDFTTSSTTNRKSSTTDVRKTSTTDVRKNSVQKNDDNVVQRKSSFKSDKTTTEPAQKEKAPFKRSETFDERCRKILGMPDKTTMNEQVEKNITDILGNIENTTTSTTSSTKINTTTNKTNEIREKRKQIEEDIKQFERQTSKDVLVDKRNLRDNIKSTSPTRSPDRKSSTPSKRNSQIDINISKSTTDESTTFKNERKISASSPTRSPDRKVPSSPVKMAPEPETTGRTTVITTTTVKTTTNERRGQTNSPSHSPDRKTPSSPSKKIIDSEKTERVTSDKTRKISNDVTTSVKSVTNDRRGPAESPSHSPDRKTSSITKKFIDTERVDVDVVQSNTRRTSKDITSSTTTSTTERRDSKAPSPTRSPVRKDSTPTKYNEPISRTPSDTFKTSPSRKPSDAAAPKKLSVTEIEIKINTDSLVKDDKTSTLRTTRKQNSTDNITRTASPTKKPVVEKKTVTSTVERTIPKIKTTDYNVDISQTTVNDKKTTVNKTNATTSNHVTTAKINIAPVITRDAPRTTNKNTTSVNEFRTTKTTNKNKTLTRDLASETEHEPDSDLDYVEVVETTTTSTTRLNNKKNAVIDRKDSAPVYSSVKKDKENVHKMTRSTSDNLFKTSTIERKRSKNDLEKKSTTPSTPSSPTKSSPKENGRPTKCVTTKTINLTAKPTPTILSDDLDNVIIDIQLAKSSREPTPNKMIPIPASPDDETGKPRYPDAVHEPDDDVPKRKPKVNNIPIFEEESNTYVGVQISEVQDERTDSTTERIIRVSEIDRVTEDDESLMSVTEKVSKFVSEADKLRDSKFKAPSTPKFERPDLNTIDEDLRTDKCLLSVSDKVTEFITSAEQDNKTKTSSPFKEVNDCHCSVTEKVTKFLNTSDESTKVKTTTSSMKPQRPQFEVDEELREDECLLSVSDKVNKFIHTAEKLSSSTPQRSPELVKNAMRQSPAKQTKPRPEELEKIEDTVDEEEDDEDEFYEEPAPKSPIGTVKGRYVPKEKPVVTPQVTLKSTEAVKKAKAIFENKASTPTSSPLPNRRDILSRPSVWEDRRAKAKTQNDVKLTDIGVYKKNDDTEIEEIVEESNVEIKSSRRNSTNASKNRTTTATSETESVKRKTSNSHEDANTFETVSIKKDDLLKSKTPLYMKDQVSSRKDIFEKKISQSKMETSFVDEEYVDQDHVTRRSTSRDYDSSKPSYMNHTVSSLEHRNHRDSSEHTSRRDSSEHSTRRDSSEHSVRRDSKTVDEKEEVYIKSDSTATRRKSSSADAAHIEEIYDLELLEKMLDTVVGYEQRRRIRAQIKSVKKMIESNTLTSTTTTSTTVNKSFGQEVPRRTEAPKKADSRVTSVRGKTTTVETTTVRKSSPTRSHVVETTTVRKTSPTRNHTTVETTTVRRSSPTRPHAIVETTTVRKSSPTRTQKSSYESEYSSSFKKQSSKQNMDTNEIDHEVEVRTDSSKRSSSPAKTNNSVTSRRVVESTSSYTTQKSGVNRNIPKESEPKDDKPIWARNNILKKASETTRTFKTSSVKKTNATEVKPKPKESTKPTDCITSSYGVGPTDENGLPLFGIRALKKKQPVQVVEDEDEDMEINSKVSGTIVTETLYSENGAAPVGERKTTHYSSDAKDFDKFDMKKTPAEVREKLLERENSRKGIISVTKTERIGENTRDSAIIDKGMKTRNSKIVRKGSVKELTEKFVHRESSSSITEKSSTQSYPKAGLILRSQSHSSRASTPGDQSDSVELDESDVEIRTMESRRESRDNTSSSRTECVEECQDRCSSKYQTNRMKSKSASNETKSFLNSETKVSNVQDVLNRMRNADNIKEDGDTNEDMEARALLNKFLGASVLMTGMESLVPRTVTSCCEDGNPNTKNQHVTSTSKYTTKTVKSSASSASSSTPVVKRTCDIEDIWDENTLKQLLDSSTNYEERRKLRARLRQIMAEKEACAEIIASVQAELDQQQQPQQDTDQPQQGPDAAMVMGEVNENETPANTVEESRTTSTTQVKEQNDDGGVITTKTIVTTRTVSAKPMSPFAKFRQLDKQNSIQSPPNSPKTPTTPTRGNKLFEFTNPALAQSAATVKGQLLQWCQSKTREYENIKIENFSTSWSDGLAFCALIHHFLPEAFDYHQLTAQKRRHNFTLAFRVADELAGIAPLLDVEDMVVMRKPDWKCVFTYVQSIYRRFRNTV